MGISSGDKLFPVRTADGVNTFLRATPPEDTGERVVILHTADGTATPVKCVPMEKEGQRGVIVKTADNVLTPVVLQTVPAAICIAWIDESEPSSYRGYYPNGNSRYDADLNEYNLLLQNNMVRSGLMSPYGASTPYPSGWVYCIPEGYPQPENIPMINCGRPPSQQDIIDFYTLLKEDFEGVSPQRILLAVDNSGSMTTSTIQPAYGEFKTWLAENEPRAEVVEREFTDERWVQEFNVFISELEE